MWTSKFQKIKIIKTAFDLNPTNRIYIFKRRDEFELIIPDKKRN